MNKYNLKIKTNCYTQAQNEHVGPGLNVMKQCGHCRAKFPKRKSTALKPKL